MAHLGWDRLDGPLQLLRVLLLADATAPGEETEHADHDELVVWVATLKDVSRIRRRLPAKASGFSEKDEARSKSLRLKVMEFFVAMDELLLERAKGSKRLTTNGEVAALEARIQAALDAEETGAGALLLLRGYGIVTNWAVTSLGIEKPTTLPRVDWNFAAMATAACGLIHAAGDAPSRADFELAHAAAVQAMEFCHWASCWHNGDMVAMRWAELACRAAAADTTQLAVVQAIEFWLHATTVCIGSLAGPYFTKATMAIGRAVATLGGHPVTPEWQHKLRGIECLPEGERGAKEAIRSKQFVCPAPDIGRLMVPPDTRADGGDGTAQAEPEEHHAWWVKSNGVTKGESRGTKATCSMPGCEVCGKVSVCARCGWVQYCSATCQRADWKGGHKRDCYPRKPEVAMPKPTVFKPALK